MKTIIPILIVLSLILLGCSTEVLKEQSADEQIDEAQAIVEKAMANSEDEQAINEAIPIITDPAVETENLEETIIENTEGVTGTTHLIKVNLKGFEPDTITISSGDTILWENVRSGNLNKVLITGSSPCTNVKSAIFMPGETFGWTFDSPVTCVFTDAISVTQIMKVIVKE